jgi:H+/Cl- antiporter ClcA
MLWGSLGGVLGGFYSLWKYVAEKQEFDRQYTTWYMLQPISGLLIGTLVHALVMTGFISMFNQVTEGGAPVAQGSQPGFWFPALMALALGFRQNFALRFLDRVIELIIKE